MLLTQTRIMKIKKYYAVALSLWSSPKNTHASTWNQLPVIIPLVGFNVHGSRPDLCQV